MRYVLILLAASAWGQTTITDTLRIPQGNSTFNGDIVITAPAMVFNSTSYTQWRQTYTITNGALNLVLIPNDTATPLGTTYSVEFFPSNQGPKWIETWRVPTSGAAVTHRAVKVVTTTIPAQIAYLPLAQLGTVGVDIGECIGNVGGVWTGVVCSGAGVSSAFGRTGAVVAVANDYAVADINGLTTALGGKEPTITAGSSGQYWRHDKTWATLNTLAVAELTNLYHTDARARAALISSGATAPASTPSAVGLTYIDTVTELVYNAVCTTSSACWRDVASSTGLANEAVTFSSQTTVTIPHNYNSSAVIVQCQDGSGIEVQGSTDTSDLNNAVVTFAVAQSGRCKANASGGGGTGGGTGDTTAVTNTGAGAQVLKGSTNITARTITAGANVTVTQNTDTIEIAATGSGGGTTYTAGTGLTLTGSAFSVNGAVIPTTQCQSVTPPAWSSIASGRYQTQTVAATGFLDVDAVFVGAHNTLAAGLFALARAGNNTVDITVINMTAGALTPATLAFKVCFARHF